MKVRTRLILALFLTSVLPLAAVTVFSYLSSRRALEEAVTAEARLAAIEMGRRVDDLTAGLERRMDRLWDVPLPAAGSGAADQPVPAPGNEATEIDPAAEVATLLGSAASFLEKVEIVPREVPRPPAATPGSSGASGPSLRAGAETAAGRPPRGLRGRAPRPPAPGRSGKIVIDLSRLLGKEVPEGASASASDAARAVQEVINKGLALGLQGALTGLKAGVEELRRRADDAQANAAERLMRERRWLRAMRERTLSYKVERQGREVGEIHATLNVDRLLAGVVALPRRAGREIPFAIHAGVIHTTRGADLATLRALGVDRRPVGTWRSGDWLVVTREDPSGITFGIAHQLGESLQEIQRASVRNLAMGLLFVTVALAGIVPLSNRMTGSLGALTAAVRRIARGDFTARVSLRSKDEFGYLGEAFNQMAHDVEAHQKLLVEQERLKRELELCRQIQIEMLPREPLRLGLTEVQGVSIPAQEVGGDFFNYFVMPGGELAVLVGDVSGKGVGAALLMANVQATLRARLPLEPKLAELIDRVDAEIDRSTPGSVYFTLFAGLLDPGSRILRYVNAGHNPQFVIRAGGGLERLPSTGLPVGLFAGHGYKEGEIALADGDLLFFYTDGTVEIENEAGEPFGADRLERLLIGEHAAGIDTLLARVERELRAHRGAAEQFDDATLMALRVGAPA